MSKKLRIASSRDGEMKGGRKRHVVRTHRDATTHQTSISSLGHHGDASFVAVGKEGGDLLGGAGLKDGGTGEGFPFPGPILSVGGEEVVVVGGGGREEEFAGLCGGGGAGGGGGGGGQDGLKAGDVGEGDGC